MNTKIIASRSWQNAKAFIEIDENNKVSVYGKFYDGGRGFPGAETKILATMPDHLVDELKLSHDERSDEFKAFCEEIWQKAKEKNDWFSY